MSERKVLRVKSKCVVFEARGESHEVLTGRRLYLLEPGAHAAVQSGDGRASARWVQLGMLVCASTFL